MTDATDRPAEVVLTSSQQASTRPAPRRDADRRTRLAGPALPKIRSGKIMRRYLRATELGEDPGDLTTLVD